MTRISFALLAGCDSGGSSPNPLGLEKHLSTVISGTPTTGPGVSASSTALDEWGTRVLMDKVFNLIEESGNLLGEVQNLDALIDEINNAVSSDNESNTFEVIPNPSGSLTLPFFDEPVPIDYLVKFGEFTTGSKYAGYKIDGSVQRVVLFSDTVLTEDGDHTVHYGKKEGTLVDIWSASMGTDSSG